MTREPYSLLFADDVPLHFNRFRENVIKKLEAEGLQFEPVDYSPGYEGTEGPGERSVRDRLRDRPQGYDLVISDLNFEERGGSRKEGFEILRRVKEHCPWTEVVLYTAYGQYVAAQEAVEVVQELQLHQGTWIEVDPRERDYGWAKIREALKILVKLVDRNRELRRLEEKAAGVPAPFDVTIHYEDEGFDVAEQCVEEPIQVEITKKGEPASTTTLELRKKQSRVWQFLARPENQRRFHSIAKIQRSLNDELRRIEYRALSWPEARAILQKIGVYCDDSVFRRCQYRRTGYLAPPGTEGAICKREYDLCVRSLCRPLGEIDEKQRLDLPSNVTYLIRDLRRKLDEHVEGWGEQLLVSSAGKGYALAADVTWQAR